jgi:hypothetical protein
MKDGGSQAECSDEGLMTDEIGQCLKPVIRAAKAAGGEKAVKWAATCKLPTPTVLGSFVTRNWLSYGASRERIPIRGFPGG